LYLELKTEETISGSGADGEDGRGGGGADAASATNVAIMRVEAISLRISRIREPNRF